MILNRFIVLALLSYACFHFETCEFEDTPFGHNFVQVVVSVVYVCDVIVIEKKK